MVVGIKAKDVKVYRKPKKKKRRSEAGKKVRRCAERVKEEAKSKIRMAGWMKIGEKEAARTSYSGCEAFTLNFEFSFLRFTSRS